MSESDEGKQFGYIMELIEKGKVRTRALPRAGISRLRRPPRGREAAAAGCAGNRRGARHPRPGGARSRPLHRAAREGKGRELGAGGAPFWRAATKWPYAGHPFPTPLPPAICGSTSCSFPRVPPDLVRLLLPARPAPLLSAPRRVPRLTCCAAFCSRPAFPVPLYLPLPARSATLPSAPCSMSPVWLVLSAPCPAC